MSSESLSKRILLSNVGKRDPYAIDAKTREQSEGSIVALCRHIKPDIVFLFPTAAQISEKTSNTQENAEDTKKTLMLLFPETKIFLYPLDLSDPTEYKQLLPVTRQMVDSVRQQAKIEYGSKAEYHINISSGTAQMQACWLLLANDGRFKAKVWQVISPEWTKEDEDRCREIETEFVDEQNKIFRSQKFFANCDFKSAKDELELLALATYLPKRALLAEEMAKVCEAYHYWDLFQHEKADLMLKASFEQLSRFPEMLQLCNKLKSQIEILQSILSFRDKENETNLIDLYNNALRRRNAQQFVDCLARFRRLYEGCQNLFIRSELHLEPNQKFKNQPEWVRKIISKHQDSYLSLPDFDKIRAEKKKKLPISDNLAKEIKDYNEMRNRSIIAHGMGSVSEEDAKLAMQLARKFMNGFFAHIDLEKYSFGESELNKISNLIYKSI